MNFAYFSILGPIALLSGACSTYETSTTFSPRGEAPERYSVESRVVLNKYFPKRSRSEVESAWIWSVNPFDPETQFISYGWTKVIDSDTESVSKAELIYRDGTEKVSYIRILPSQENNPKKVKVHYFMDKDLGRPALDRREWVALPERGQAE